MKPSLVLRFNFSVTWRALSTLLKENNEMFEIIHCHILNEWKEEILKH